MADKMYDEKYFEQHCLLPPPPYLFNTILRCLINADPKIVLDVGCGGGKMINKLKLKGFEAYGIDISSYASKNSKQIRASGTHLPFKDESFSAILATLFIEHLTREQGIVFISECKHLLKRGGVLFLTTDNFISLSRLLLKRKWIGYTPGSRHKFFYSPFTLRKLLKSYGFNEIRFFFPIDAIVLGIKEGYYLATQIPNIPFRRLINNFLLILLTTTPLAIMRDPFWMCARK